MLVFLIPNIGEIYFIINTIIINGVVFMCKIHMINIIGGILL